MTYYCPLLDRFRRIQLLESEVNFSENSSIHFFFFLSDTVRAVFKLNPINMFCKDMWNCTTKKSIIYLSERELVTFELQETCIFWNNLPGLILSRVKTFSLFLANFVVTCIAKEWHLQVLWWAVQGIKFLTILLFSLHPLQQCQVSII